VEITQKNITGRTETCYVIRRVLIFLNRGVEFKACRGG